MSWRRYYRASLDICCCSGLSSLCYTSMLMHLAFCICFSVCWLICVLLRVGMYVCMSVCPSVCLIMDVCFVCMPHVILFSSFSPSPAVVVAPVRF